MDAPNDAYGKRRTLSDVPKLVAELVDDPYGSLAGDLRRNRVFGKDEALFASAVAVEKSMRLARSVEAR